MSISTVCDRLISAKEISLSVGQVTPQR